MYYGLNPYQYCANNPVLFIDINGDSIDFGGDAKAEDLYNTYKGVLEELAGAEGGNKDAEAALGELGKMEGCKQIFKIGFEEMDEDKGGKFGYEGDDNFTVKVNTESDHKVGSLAHELKHGYQYLNGEVDFDDKRNPGILGGKEDEWNANERAKLVGGGMSDKDFEKAYGNMNYGDKSLGERNTKQLNRYFGTANKEGWKYNYE